MNYSLEVSAIAMVAVFLFGWLWWNYKVQKNGYENPTYGESRP